jgi:ADP-heptose:LPS heptosyltransferase
MLHQKWEATLVMVGGEEEVSLVEEIQERSRVPALNLAGRLSLGGLAALLSRVDLFVGNDSGPAQMAAAVAPRSVRIFGPANRQRWAPLDRLHHRTVYHPVECSPCGHWECPIDHRCLRWIGVEEVLAEVESLMQEAAMSPAPQSIRTSPSPA